MSVGEAMERMDSIEISNWQAFFSIRARQRENALRDTRAAGLAKTAKKQVKKR